MENKDLEAALAQGFPLPGEAVREKLLERCLAVLGADGEDAGDGEVIDDDMLDMLAAAGNVNARPLDIEGDELI